MKNPFGHIKFGVFPVFGESFIGRKHQLDKLINMVISSKCHHISIYGLPHIGKSSFLSKINEELSQKEGYLCTSVITLVEGDFCNNIIRILDELTAIDTSLEYLCDEIRDDSGPKELIDIMYQALNKLSQTHLRTVLFLDEFERILGSNDEQLAGNVNIQGWTQEEYELFLNLLLDQNLNFVCITGSRPPMSNILYRYRPVINPFVSMVLTGFNDMEMDEYFDVLKQGDIRLEGELIGLEKDKIQQQELLRLCGHNPYLLTVMGNELFENNSRIDGSVKKTVKGLFDGCRDTFQRYFNDIINFMVSEEHKKMRSFSHIVKCYFGQFDDYQDIKERCIAKGYLELAPKNSPYTYLGKICEFDDRDNKFEVIQKNGALMTYNEKKTFGLVYTTVSPLFTYYLFSVYHPIGIQRIIPIDMIDDARDLLTGLIHALRDITRQEICKKYGVDDKHWDELLVSLYRASNDYNGTVQQIIHINPESNSNKYRYTLWEKNGTDIICKQRQAHYVNQPTFDNWQSLWNSRCINIELSSLKYVLIRMQNRENEMASLDPINLTDHMAIIDRFWDERFKKYFTILPGGKDELERMIKGLKEYRNKISHFSRYGYGTNEIEDSKKYCRILLTSIYYYLYSGKSCPKLKGTE